MMRDEGSSVMLQYNLFIFLYKIYWHSGAVRKRVIIKYLLKWQRIYSIWAISFNIGPPNLKRYRFRRKCSRLRSILFFFGRMLYFLPSVFHEKSTKPVYYRQESLSVAVMIFGIPLRKIMSEPIVKAIYLHWNKPRRSLNTITC